MSLDGFEEMEAPPPRATTQKGPVRIGMWQIKSGTPRLYVAVRKDILDLLGGKAYRYWAALGKGADAHNLRLVQDDAGPFEGIDPPNAKGGQSQVLIIRLGHSDRLPSCRLPLQDTSYQHDKTRKCLLIGLPSWAFDARRKDEVEKIAAKARLAV